MAESKHIIIGTAGHVDHGKTSLIRALTGVNTDRLREEQERGMSIELGFASFALPSGIQAGIVDVPGHERFLKNMLAGAAGMDLVLLVVAADEGVMPQTVEHLDILEILRAKTGLVALTKADLVDEEWIDLVREDLAAQLRGTFLEGAPLLPVSSETGQGLEALVAALDEQARSVRPKSDLGPFRLPVDRAFTLSGFGTVVTGTLWSGRIAVGDAVELQPAGLASRVRGLQSHGVKTESASAGSRVAVNLVGVEVAQVERGAVLAPPGLLKPSRLMDAQLSLLSRLSAPVKHRTRIRLHLGTAEVIGRVSLLDRDELGPGETAFVQLQLEEDAAALRGDRFVLRLYSPMVTLGGGVILDPVARRHRRRHEATLDRLGVLLAGSPEDHLLQLAREAGLSGLLRKDAAAALGITPAQAQELLARVSGTEEQKESPGNQPPNAAGGLPQPPLRAIGDRFFHPEALESGARRCEELLAAFHRESPLRMGLSREELKSRVAPKLEARMWNALLDRWVAAGRLQVSGASVSLPGHEVVFSDPERLAAEVIEEAYRQGGFDPPAEEEVLARLPKTARGPEVLAALVEQGRLEKIAQGLYLHRECYDRALEVLREQAAAQGTVSVGQMRDALGSSRKVIVPLLEHLDSLQITRRLGDTRVLLT